MKKRILLLTSLVLVAIATSAYILTQFLSGSRASEVGAQTAELSIAVKNPDGIANQEGSKVILANASANSYIGTAGTTSNAVLGLYFENVNIPAGAVVKSARIQLTSSQDSWIQLRTTVALENTINPKPYSSSSPPAKRSTVLGKRYENNIQWKKDQSDTATAIDVTEQLKRLQFMRGSTTTGPVSIIIRSDASKWARKFFYNKGDQAPRLILTYTSGTGATGTVATPTTSLPLSTSAPTVAVSPIPGSPTPMLTGMTHNPAGGDSHAMNKWIPNPKYDFCKDSTGNRVGATDAEASAYIKSVHESYHVIGPDGKKYPTWHAPVVTTAKGETCVFGHEHGTDPKLSEVWKTKQVQNYFYYDANKNGTMDPAEEAVTGLPFGYVNEQMEAYYASLGQDVHRHEDHVGHKVDYANGEGDISTHKMSTASSGGVWVGKATSDGIISPDSGVRCYYLAKPHQGTSTPDAFTNNLHEVFYFVDCRHPNPAYNQKVSLAVMEGFGKPGGFTKFMPMCGVERREDPQDFVNIGTDDRNNAYPGGDGNREIISRDCIEQGFLVPEGRWSGNMYEAWPANLSVETADGRKLATGVNLLFDVENANRYYYPEELKVQRGYNNPEAGRNLGFSMDLCYDTSLLSQGRKYRGGPCDWSTDYGQLKDIKWNDPRSGFKGTNRGMYFKPPVLNNASGPEFWYTDPYGYNAKTTAFPGAVKQQVSSKTINYTSLTGGVSIDPRVKNMKHSDGNGTVHAPN